LNERRIVENVWMKEDDLGLWEASTFYASSYRAIFDSWANYIRSSSYSWCSYESASMRPRLWPALPKPNWEQQSQWQLPSAVITIGYP
jgi:hypothetical protein